MGSTFVEVLRRWAAREPLRMAFTFLVDDEGGQSTITYGELDRRARTVARWLQANGAYPGDRVLLLYPPGIDYIVCFLGCLYAGVVAVPAYPPRNERNLPRIETILRNAQAEIALTAHMPSANINAELQAQNSRWHTRWLVTDHLSNGIERGWREPALTSETLAFLQYTSGSTGSPKGVMLSHRNLLHNSEQIRQSFNVTSKSRVLSWLPPYHDMGLIGCLLQPLYTGGHAILMSPGDFLQRPFRWLDAISRFGATHSGGPNFAYELCLRKITPQQRTGLKLHQWRVAFNGAEPVRAETLTQFASMFEECGFQSNAFAPCYGLAESTLLVAGHLRMNRAAVTMVDGDLLERNLISESPVSAGSTRVVSGSGRICPEMKSIIVNPESRRRCSPAEIGEIWVSGQSVAQGYWNMAEETERIFRAYLSDTGEGPFLRTGDLGFMKEGELFVTGRLKDLVIICGRNLYPQDIEITAEQSHPDLKSGTAVAFSLTVEGEERLAIVQEHGHRHAPNLEEMTRAIRRAVAEEHGVQVHAVELIRPGSLPRTSSGKVERYACKAKFLAKSLDSFVAIQQ